MSHHCQKPLYFAGKLPENLLCVVKAFMVMRWRYQREIANSVSVTVMEHKKLDLALQSVTSCRGSASANHMS
jgi:hypothetical protein